MLNQPTDVFETSDLLAYTNKDDWTETKKNMYRINIIKQLGATTF
jgi:hypothetical protein